MAQDVGHHDHNQTHFIQGDGKHDWQAELHWIYHAQCKAFSQQDLHCPHPAPKIQSFLLSPSHC
eukprot:4276618-Ditylum_brightwellii.AAC.1